MSLTTHPETRELLDLFRSKRDLAFLRNQRLELTFPRRTTGETGRAYTYSPLDALRTMCRDARTLLEAINRATSKFDFKRTTPYEWQHCYLFPSLRPSARALPSITSASHHANDAIHNPDVLNKSRKNAAEWIEGLLTHMNGSGDPNAADRRLTYILGKVGSGKSTFVKYILNVHVPSFRNMRVIPTRIECSKLGFYKRTAECCKDALFETITRCVVRDIFRILSSPTDTGSPVPGVLLTQEFRDFLHEQLFDIAAQGGTRSLQHSSVATEELRSSFATEQLRRLEGYARDSRRSREHLQRLNRTVCELVVLYLYKQGYGFLIVLDGFDYISAADSLLDSGACNWLRAASDAIYGWGGERVLAHINGFIPMHFIVVLRENTLADFSRRHPQTNPRGMDEVRRFVVAPTSEQLLRSTVRRVCRDSEYMTYSSVLDIFKKARTQALTALDLPEGMLPDDIFNGNARFMLRFFLNTLLMVLHEVVHVDGRTSSVDAFTKLLNEDVEKFITKHRYRVLEILLLTYHKRFSNFVSIDYGHFAKLQTLYEQNPDKDGELEALAKMCFRDCDEEAGYFDNIYNYHNAYSGQRGGDDKWTEKVFLEKLWILKLMPEGTAGLYESDIRDLLQRHFNYNPAGLNWTLALMVKNGQLSMIGQESPVPLYYAEGHGKYAAEVLWKKLAYVEHVFHQSLYPRQIATRGIDCVKYDNLPRWPFAAIVNSYLHLQYVSYIEAQIDRGMNGSPQRGMISLCSELRDSVCDSVRRMCERDSLDKGSHNKRSWLSSMAIQEIKGINEYWSRLN